MSDLSTFLAMGGYAAFVWPAYAISIGALVTLGIVSWRNMRRAERQAQRADSSD
jgi:heme exporter protein D